MTSKCKRSFFSHLKNAQKTSNYSISTKSSSYSHIRDVQPTGFHNLPVNVLLLIFKNLSEFELRRNIIPVCHKWKQVALLPELWHSITFRGLQVPSKFICEQLRSFPNLQNINLINIDDTATVIRQICRCNTQIETIIIKQCRNDKVDERVPERVLRNLVASCKNLKKINLKGTLFSGNTFFLEAALLPSLKIINLSSNEYLTTKNIFQFILNSSKLEEFKLSYRGKRQRLSDNDAVFLFSNLKSSVKSITFDMTELTENTYRVLLDCDKLEKLCLYNASNISSDTLSKITTKLPHLQYLKFHHSQISTNEIMQLLKVNRTNLHKLKCLNLTGSWKLKSDGLTLLIENCPNLQKAVFKCCKNIENIQCLINNCKKLKILDVAFCPKISDENILDAAMKLPLLNTLYIDVTRSGIVDIIKKNKFNLQVCIYLSEFNKNMNKIP